jgi:hypothetical protein
LVDVVVADENLNQGSLSCWSLRTPGPPKTPEKKGARLGAAASDQKEIGSQRLVAQGIERGEISEGALDVHAAGEAFRLAREVA